MKITLIDRGAGARLRILFGILAAVLVSLAAVGLNDLCRSIAISRMPKTWKPGQNRQFDDLLAAIQTADADYARHLPRGVVVDQLPLDSMTAMNGLHEGSFAGWQFGERPRLATAADYSRPHVLYNPQFAGYVLPAAISPPLKVGPEPKSGVNPPPPRDRAIDLVFHDGRFHVKYWYLLRDNGKLIPEEKRVKHYLP
jgi:hypothetical protein